MFAPIVVSQLCTQRVDEHGFICLSAHERRTLFGAETRRCDSGLHRVSRGKSPGSRYWQWNCELRTSEPEPAPTDATTQKRGSESQKQPESIWACPRMTFAKPDTVTHVGRLCPKHDGPDTGTLSAIDPALSTRLRGRRASTHFPSFATRHAGDSEGRALRAATLARQRCTTPRTTSEVERCNSSHGHSSHPSTSQPAPSQASPSASKQQPYEKQHGRMQ